MLWVTDPRKSAAFYAEALGLVVMSDSDTAVFMTSPGSATDHDLGLFKTPVQQLPDPRQIGLYHLAWEVGTLADLQAAKTRLSAMGALVGENNHGVSRSLYCQDPDGIEFEVMWEVPEDLLDPESATNTPLDFGSDFQLFGPDTPGRGVS